MASKTKEELKAFLRPTRYAKQLRADIMYEKGKEFVAASILLKNHKPKSTPQIHLLLQGLEILLKAFLLYTNYDKYSGALKKFGHDIPKLVHEVRDVHSIKLFDRKFDDELESIYNLYKYNSLRYGGAFDILVDVGTFSVTSIEKETYELIRIMNDIGQRELK